MNKINIEIPDNLDQNQEVLEIAKQISKKILPNNKKIIGTGYDIKNLQTQINIKRISVEKETKIESCMVCGMITEKKLTKTLWTNYGGITKKHFCCSHNCRESVINVLGVGRASKNKKDLKLFPSFFKK